MKVFSCAVPWLDVIRCGQNELQPHNGRVFVETDGMNGAVVLNGTAVLCLPFCSKGMNYFLCSVGALEIIALAAS